jgi:hypothetical protein
MYDAQTTSSSEILELRHEYYTLRSFLLLATYTTAHTTVFTAWVTVCPFVIADSEASVTTLIPKSAHGRDLEAVGTTSQPLNRSLRHTNVLFHRSIVILSMSIY